MDRHGHVGLNLLVFTPIAYYLIRSNRVALVVFGLLGLLMVEPLVDLDRLIPGVEHRGTSHSLFAALVVGVVCGVSVYVFSGYLITSLTKVTFGQPVIVSGSTEQSPFNLTRNAQIGFVIGSGSVLLHLLGDSLTASVRPLLPFARSQHSFDLISPQGWSQFVLFAGGLLACGGLIVVALA
ncbi:metal-dependent hydrolase [Halocatena salina]|uniref:Metal-dependent hydrolase n=1 Tax=Halocatena salina TaxID=2934340 RepID=A0A8U0A318_9EURY|nr:metal-dependent hydrolase [Halocatena salina]UPM43585.1 metal-dependent hydrolase [Halocatena salina]